MSDHIETIRALMGEGTAQIERRFELARRYLNSTKGDPDYVAFDSENIGILAEQASTLAALIDALNDSGLFTTPERYGSTTHARKDFHDQRSRRRAG